MSPEICEGRLLYSIRFIALKTHMLSDSEHLYPTSITQQPHQRSQDARPRFMLSVSLLNWFSDTDHKRDTNFHSQQALTETAKGFQDCCIHTWSPEKGMAGEVNQMSWGHFDLQCQVWYVEVCCTQTDVNGPQVAEASLNTTILLHWMMLYTLC